MMHDKDKLLLKIANAIVANISNIKSMKNIILPVGGINLVHT